jgi:hypothetical protein
MPTRNSTLTRSILTIALSWAANLADAQVISYPEGDKAYIASRRSSAGTNLARASVEEREVGRDQIAQVINQSLAEGLRGCTREAKAQVRVAIENDAVRDPIGGTNTRLQGLGLYVSLPDAGLESRGTWYIAPYAYLTLKVSSGDGRIVETIRVANSRKVEIERDLLGRSDFFKLETKELLEALSPILQQSIEDRAKLLAAICP